MELSTYKELLQGPIDKIIAIVGDELKQSFSNQILEYQVYEYKRNYFSKTILHRAEPKKLDEFYQPLFIVRCNQENKRISTASISSLFNKSKYLTFIGSAGSGKSTMLKYLFINSIKENFKIPIKVELRYLNDYKGNIIDYIHNEIFKFQKLGFSSTIIDRLLSRDNFVFFFDGYDEINSSIKELITKDIDSFVKKYPENYFIITSRPYTNIDLLPLFVNHNVCNLNEGEIASFVKKQIPKEEIEIAEKIIKSINSKENHSYSSFLSNPLLLSMFILTYQSYSDIPQKRSEFYSQVFDTLFSVHDSMSKLAYVREKQTGLPKEKFEEILRTFSFISFFEEKFLFSSSYLTDKLSFIKSKKSNITFNNHEFIEDIQVAIGILNKEGLEYTFPHRSLQEYFAASYIEKISVENKEIIYNKLKNNLLNDFKGIFGKEHFYHLLSELDNNYMVTFLTIPILKQLLSEIKNDSNIYDSGNYYHYYGVFLLTCMFLLNIRRENPIVEEKLFKFKAKEYMISSNEKTNKFIIPELKVSHKDFSDSLELMIKQVEFMKNNGDFIIEIVSNTVEEKNKSDQEIIDMI